MVLLSHLGQKDSFLRLRLVWSWQVPDKMPSHSSYIKHMLYMYGLSWGSWSFQSVSHFWILGEKIFVAEFGPGVHANQRDMVVGSRCCLCLSGPCFFKPLDTPILNNQWIMKASCERMPINHVADLSCLFLTSFHFPLVPVIASCIHYLVLALFPFDVFHLKLMHFNSSRRVLAWVYLPIQSNRPVMDLVKS